MTTNHLNDFHNWLQYALPLSAGEIMAELQLSHKALPAAAVEGLPRNALELRSAIEQLEARRLIERRDGLWFWKAEPVRVEPQGVLFG